MSRDMEPPRTMTTYRRADGEMVADEFGWVTDTEYFESDDVPTQYVQEEWALVSRKTIWFPDHAFCDQCGEDVSLPTEYTDGLLRCKTCVGIYGTIEDNPEGREPEAADPPCAVCGWELSHIRHIDPKLHNFHNYKAPANLPEDWGEPSPGER